jgi:hypothetical protein
MTVPEPNHTLITISSREIQAVADRLYSRGVSSLSTCDRHCQADLIAGSRIIRALLRRYERTTGRQLEHIMIAGEVA